MKEAKCRRLRIIMDGPPPTVSVSSPFDVYIVMKKFLELADRENFYVIHVNAQNKCLGVELVGMGTLTNSLVNPREIFKAAVVNNSVAIVLSHNHPSGDPRPSREDISITERLVSAGELLGISVLDHVIIGQGNYYSMQNRGFIKSSPYAPPVTVAAEKATTPDRGRESELGEIIRLLEAHPETRKFILKILKARKATKQALKALSEKTELTDLQQIETQTETSE